MIHLLRTILGLSSLARLGEVAEKTLEFGSDPNELFGVGPSQLALASRAFDRRAVQQATDLVGPAFTKSSLFDQRYSAEEVGIQRAFGSDPTVRTANLGQSLYQRDLKGFESRANRAAGKAGGSLGAVKQGKMRKPALQEQYGFASVEADELGRRTGTVRAVPSALDRAAYRSKEAAQRRGGKKSKLSGLSQLRPREAVVRVSPGSRAVSAFDNMMLERQLNKLSSKAGGKPLTAKDLESLPTRYSDRVIPTPKGQLSGKMARTVVSGPGSEAFKIPKNTKMLGRVFGGLSVGLDAVDAAQDAREGNVAGVLGNVADMGLNLFLPGALVNTGVSSLGLDADGVGELTADVLTGKTSAKEVGEAVVDKGKELPELVDAAFDFVADVAALGVSLLD